MDNSGLGSPRASQRSFGSRSRYTTPNLSKAHVPLPERLQMYKEIIYDVINGDLANLKQKLASIQATEVVHIRGVQNIISDLLYEEDGIETVMWNPLHFAVYHGQLAIVKYLIEELKINLSVTAPKALGESEKDPTNSVNFPEDKIMLLLITYAKRDSAMLEYLLDELWYFWSITFVEHIFTDINSQDQDPWLEAIPIVLRSRTLNTFFLNLSFKKRQKWLAKFIGDMTSGNNVDQSSPMHESRTGAYKQEMTRQPYAGFYLFYLMFKENSDDYEIAEMALVSATQFDFLVHISLMEED